MTYLKFLKIVNGLVLISPDDEAKELLIFNNYLHQPATMLVVTETEEVYVQ